MNENMDSSAVQSEKWLRMLMYIAIATLANTAISFLPVVPAVLTSWIARAIMVAMIVCMFRWNGHLFPKPDHLYFRSDR